MAPTANKTLRNAKMAKAQPVLQKLFPNEMQQYEHHPKCMFETQQIFEPFTGEVNFICNLIFLN